MNIINNNKLSVIICSHNPKNNNLVRTLDSLRNQTLSTDHWELRLIDNQSVPPLSERIDLSWHPQASIIVESTLGLTHARVKGIQASKGEIFVFVDDDNLLSPDYLENASLLGSQFPFLGAWGGSSLPEYEEPPAEGVRAFESLLALRFIDRATWSNKYFDFESTPIGAGMCIRKSVAREYAIMTGERNNGITLGRKGNSLMSCEDHDLAWTSFRLGMGVGVFPSLSLIHIIPTFRIKEEYLIRLQESGTYSSAVLRRRILEREHDEQLTKPTTLRGLIKQPWHIFNDPERSFFILKMSLAARRGNRKELFENNQRTKQK